jgi:hypothetical protein
VSYSGYREFLCANGHYARTDCWDDDPSECSFCKAKIAQRNSVDTTNGQNDDEAWSMPAAKHPAGFDDKWHQDHYGNRYATKVLKYKPKGEQWRTVEQA